MRTQVMRANSLRNNSLRNNSMCTAPTCPASMCAERRELQEREKRASGQRGVGHERTSRMRLGLFASHISEEPGTRATDSMHGEREDLGHLCQDSHASFA